MWLGAAYCSKCGRTLTTPAPRQRGLGIGIFGFWMHLYFNRHKAERYCAHSLACDALSRAFRGEIDIFGNGIGGDNGL
jgi:hypothetical protein